MTQHLPAISGAQLVRALKRAGFEAKRQTGSHIVLQSSEIDLVVPNHRTVARGTLAGILRKAGLTADDLRKLL